MLFQAGRFGERQPEPELQAGVGRENECRENECNGACRQQDAGPSSNAHAVISAGRPAYLDRRGGLEGMIAVEDANDRDGPRT